MIVTLYYIIITSAVLVFVVSSSSSCNTENTGTSWTPCSKSCGMGIQVRYAPNEKCNKIERQTRLCHTRPCMLTDSQENVVLKNKIKKHKRHSSIERLFDKKISVKKQCRKKKTNIKKTGRIFLNYAGCTTRKSYSLKYCVKTCGTAKKPMCCEENKMKTFNVRFYCRTDNFEDGDWESCRKSRDGKYCSFVKEMAVVKSCKCGKNINCPRIRDKYEVPNTKIIYQWNLKNDMFYKNQ